jgi:AraC family transcriptional regulator
MEFENNYHFTHLNEKNKVNRTPLPNKNIISISELKSAYFKNVIHDYSIKLTLKGAENYKINGKEFKVPELCFLTATAPCDSVGYFESDSIVKGLCIEIKMELINDAFTVLSEKNKIDLDNNFLGYFKSEKFFENVYPAFKSELGIKLFSIAEKFNPVEKKISFINYEMFLELTEIVIEHECENLRNLNLLSSLKISTKKEILKRLLQGRNFIDDNFKEKIDVKEIARLSCLSEFHFFRSFREAFGISPHNYIIKRRLKEAQKLLQTENASIGEIAFECGFADIHSFSKSFKKNLGYSPSRQPIKN